jgi:hypothetical protein
MPFKVPRELVAGKISDETYEEWNRSTGKATLPERVKPKAKVKSRSKSHARVKRKTR